ncbi:MAG: T9SS type A sorting domain-containing protein [Muribaculaceae bacterium]|nr:T9SS type A sorting domain-containing protein [Muribaculaceae bacterium]
MTVTSPISETINVYSIDGRLAATVAAESGETISIPVAPGIYILKGIKVVVK